MEQINMHSHSDAAKIYPLERQRQVRKILAEMKANPKMNVSITESGDMLIIATRKSNSLEIYDCKILRLGNIWEGD